MMALLVVGFFYLLITGETTANLYGPFPTQAACVQDREDYAWAEATSECWQNPEARKDDGCQEWSGWR